MATLLQSSTERREKNKNKTTTTTTNSSFWPITIYTANPESQSILKANTCSRCNARENLRATQYWFWF